MSEKLEFPGPLRPIEQTAADLAHARAMASPRHRAIVRYHEHEEAIQRMLNAVEPESYVRPHRHADPAKLEVFLALRGRGRVVDEAGAVTSVVTMAAHGPTWGVEIPAGVWHSLIVDEPGTVLYEVIEGAYTPSTHKDYADWAPPEGSEEGQAFLAALRVRVNEHAAV